MDLHRHLQTDFGAGKYREYIKMLEMKQQEYTERLCQSSAVVQKVKLAESAQQLHALLETRSLLQHKQLIMKLSFIPSSAA